MNTNNNCNKEDYSMDDLTDAIISEKNVVKNKIISDLDILLNNKQFTREDMVELQKSWGDMKANITDKMNQRERSVAAAASGTKEPPSLPSDGASSSKPNAQASSSACAKSNNIPAIDLRVPIATKPNNSTRPTKKGKTEQHFIEIKWYEYDSDKDPPDVNHSMFVDDIPKGTKFSDCRAFQKKYEGENHQYGLSFCLVDNKSEHRKVLVEIDAYYWNLPINLMHFHILSQDLANFSRKLWVAAGKNEDLYDDMSIEFGYSNIGKWEVKKLVGAAVGIKRKSDVMYVSDVKMHPGSTVEDSLKQLEMIFKTCKSAIVIVYESDLKKLDIVENYDTIGLTKMRNFCCYIGPNRKF